jgi:hypothetical protein
MRQALLHALFSPLLRCFVSQGLLPFAVAFDEQRLLSQFKCQLQLETMIKGCGDAYALSCYQLQLALQVGL